MFIWNRRKYASNVSRYLSTPMLKKLMLKPRLCFFFFNTSLLLRKLTLIAFCNWSQEAPWGRQSSETFLCIYAGPWNYISYPLLNDTEHKYVMRITYISIINHNFLMLNKHSQNTDYVFKTNLVMPFCLLPSFSLLYLWTLIYCSLPDFLFLTSVHFSLPVLLE